MFNSKLFDIFNSGIARSVFFIIFTGGLLLFSSIVFANICNITVLNRFEMPCLSYLEATGILAFAYVIGFGIKFGLSKSDLTNSLMSKIHNSDKSAKILDNLKKMTDEEKLILKKELADCCGMNKKNNPQEENLELTHK
jgi:hypothetical protein